MAPVAVNSVNALRTVPSLAILALASYLDFFHQVFIAKRSFFNGTSHENLLLYILGAAYASPGQLLPALHDESIGPFIISSLITFGRNTPRRNPFTVARQYRPVSAR